MILAFETSGALGSVALLDREQLRASREFSTQQEACKRLPVVVQELLEGANPGEIGLQGLAVSRGPGSFTGLRVGLSFAKAMAHALSLPVVGIGTPQAWATEGAERFPEPPLAVLQPARRNHVYLTYFQPRVRAQPLGPTTVVPEEQIAGNLADRGQAHTIVLTGDWPRLDDFCSANTWAQADTARRLSPAAATIAHLATPLLPETPLESCFTLRPDYIGLSQAERSQGVNLDR